MRVITIIIIGINTRRVLLREIIEIQITKQRR